MLLIDTHAHLNFKAFAQDRDGVIKRSLAENVWLINASSNYKTSKLAVEISEQYDAGVFASVGLHPINCVVDLSQADEDRLEELNIEKYRELAKSKGVVAIGEIGLDYADFVLKQSERQQNRAPAVALSLPKGEGGLGIYTEKVKEKQKEVFLKQLDLAKELNLPVIFHCRKALDDLIKILLEFSARRNSSDRTKYVRPQFQGVLHCFTGTWQQAEKFLEMDLYLGFNGIIFKFNVDEVIKKTPLDRMLVETDCPFLTPVGVKAERNEPLYVKYVAQRIAEIRDESFEKIAEITTQNAQELFNLKK